ncbi:hypothetical protein J6590_073541 [Homalodisca vitripennis]|nr:hypothetical protein J6590_073541 [Homalodisca vitripennis]
MEEDDNVIDDNFSSDEDNKSSSNSCRDGEGGVPHPQWASTASDMAGLRDMPFTENIIRQTNLYALELFCGPTTTPASRISKWKDLVMAKLRTFLGLLLLTGNVRLNRLNDYWNTHRLLNFPPKEAPLLITPTRNSMHRLSKLTKRKGNGKSVTRRCRVCYQEGKRKETVYYCAVCPDEPVRCKHIQHGDRHPVRMTSRPGTDMMSPVPANEASGIPWTTLSAILTPFWFLVADLPGSWGILLGVNGLEVGQNRAQFLAADLALSWRRILGVSSLGISQNGVQFLAPSWRRNLDVSSVEVNQNRVQFLAACLAPSWRKILA